MSVTDRTVVQGSRVYGYAIMSGSQKAKYMTKKWVCVSLNSVGGGSCMCSAEVCLLRCPCGQSLCEETL